MLMISQDKETIVNMDNIVDIRVEGKEVIATSKTSYLLGVYCDKEEAKSVLEKILLCYKFFTNGNSSNSVYEIPPNDGKNRENPIGYFRF